MESPKATSLLNEILQKLSLLTKEDELAQGLEDIQVEEEVVLSEEEEAPAGEVQEETPEATEELAEEVSEEATEEVAEEIDLAKGYVTEEAFASKMEEMEAKLAMLMKKVDEDLTKYETEKQEMAAQIEKLSAEPAAEPIVHDPEANTEERKTFNYGMDRPESALDRIFTRINNK